MPYFFTPWPTKTLGELSFFEVPEASNRPMHVQLSTYLHLGHRNSSDYGTYSKMCTQVHKMTTSCCIPLYFACQHYFEKSLGNWKKKWKIAWYSFLLSWILISSFRPNGNNNSTIMFCITYLSRIGKSKMQHLEPRFVS